MEIVITDSADEASGIVAGIFDAAVRAGAKTIGLATGSSPLGVYRDLARRHRDEGLSFAGVQAFLLDEYVGLRRDHPQAYAQFIRDEFVSHVDLDSAAVHSPDGTTGDPLSAAIAYEESIVSGGPIDVQLLGIGGNGHIGFNEPSSSLSSLTRVKTLTEQTRNDNARFFDTIDEVPTHVITQGLGTIGRSRHAVLIASGEHKAAAIAAAVEGPVTASCPASVLQLHPHATIVIDTAAASTLANTEFYRWVHAHKPAGQGY